MSCFCGPDIVTDGLIMYLDAANDKSYPGSGTTWYDLTDNGNNGTIVNGEFVSDNGGYLRNVNNLSNQFNISVAHTSSINSALSVTTGGWTIQEIIWTNSTTYPEADGGSIFSAPAYGTGATGFDWNHAKDTTSFRFGMSNNSSGSYDVDFSISVPEAYRSLNAWIERTMIWNRTNNKCQLYINATYIGEGSTSAVSGETIYDGGGGSIGTVAGWRHYGRRASIKIYNKVLSTTEMTKNFNAVKGRFGL